MTEPYLLEQGNGQNVAFDGTLLAEVTSRTDEKHRWMEVRIYRTVSQMYVTEVVGCSDLPSETDLTTVTVCDAPGKVLRALRRNPDKNYVTYTAMEAYRIAAEKDPELAKFLVRHI